MAEARRILFVDDEENVLKGIRRQLWDLEGWELECCCGGEQALSRIDAGPPCDIVVTDLRMPRVDGLEILVRVRQVWPQAFRFVLSGHADRDVIFRAAGLGHRILAKPCEREQLKREIEAAEAIRRHWDVERARRVVGELEPVPATPRVFESLLRELAESEPSLERIGDLIATDPGLSTTVLKIVNSAYYGPRTPVVSVHRAVAHLGLEAIGTQALFAHLLNHGAEADLESAEFEWIWASSLQAAQRISLLSQGAGRRPATDRGGSCGRATRSHRAHPAVDPKGRGVSRDPRGVAPIGCRSG